MIKNLKISLKLTMGFGIALLGLLIVIIIGLINLGNLNDAVHVLGRDRFPKTIWANDIIDNVNINARVLRNIILLDDPVEKQKEMLRFEETKKTVDARFDSLNKTIKSEKGKELLNNLNKARNNFFDVRNTFLGYVNTGQIELAKAMLFKEMRNAQYNYLNAINDLIKYQYKLVNEAVENAESTYSSNKNLLLIISIIILITVVAIGKLITNSIVKPITMVKERMFNLENVCLTNLGNGLNLLSRGDLNAKVEKATQPLKLDIKDEIGEMANVFDSMLYKAQAGIDAYELTRDKINTLTIEIDKVINDAQNGLLDNRGNSEKFEGVYRKLIDGLNQTLDAVIIPIQDGAKVLEKMATGDFTQKISKDYKGQHAKLKETINKLSDSVSEVIRNINDAVQATASASNQISSSTEELAAGAQEQSAQTSEIASAINQMTATIIQTTRHAGEAANTAKDAGNFAQEGGKAVEKTIDGMNKIANVVTKAARVVQELGKGSEQIGEIVQVIDDIADQTNLLALNAAIEAARAGEQGRGFAVVADEVRKLAERTTKATKEIANMIKKIQVDTNEAVVSMNQGTSEVEVGIELAQNAGSSLREIINTVIKVSDIISQVAAASEEQSSTAEQVSKNVESISNVAHETASGTQQIARAAEDLNRLTENLQNLISQFQIDGTSSSLSNMKLNPKRSYMLAN